MDKLIAFFEIVSRYSGFYLYGFGVFYLVFNLINKPTINNSITSAKGIIPVAGVIFFLSESIYYGLPFLSEYYDGTSYTQYAFGNSNFSNIYTIIVFPIIFKFVPTQLFWFEKMRIKRWLPLLCVPFFLFDFSRFYIFITSFHRDYLPSTWSMSSDSFIETLIFSFFWFLFVTLFWNYKYQIKDTVFKIVRN